MTLSKLTHLSNLATDLSEAFIRFPSNDLGNDGVIPPFAASRGYRLRIECLGDGVETEPCTSQLNNAPDVLDLFRMDGESAVQVRVAIGGIGTWGSSIAKCVAALRRSIGRADANSSLHQSLANGRF